MEYDISVHPDGYVQIVVSGPMDFAGTEQMVQDAVVVAVEHGLNAFLADVVNAIARFRAYEACELFDNLNCLGIGRGARIAFIYARDPAEHRHAENVAVNRGYKFRGFTDGDAARKWLLA